MRARAFATRPLFVCECVCVRARARVRACRCVFCFHTLVFTP
jgi:hypothetical protein